MSTLIIGDIHGSYDALRILLRKAKWMPEQDELWFTGDLIGRGLKSLAVLRFVHALGDRAKLVLGNHELRLLATQFVGRHAVRDQDLAEICAASDYEYLCNWLSKQPIIRRDERRQCLLVHAGLIPNWPLSDILEVADYLQALLITRSSATKALLRWNKPAILSQSTAETSEAMRLSYALTALTSIRFCNPSGDLHLRSSGPPHTAKPPWIPWYKVQHESWANYTVFFGHWAAAANARFPDKIRGLDTGYIWGKQLSAWSIEEERLIQVTPQEVAQGRGALK